MKTKKAILSLFLLFAYSIGFSHYLIPHCENAHELEVSHQSDQGGMHFHQHHDLTEEYIDVQNEKHKHFQHEGHYDEGIYDLIVCFLSEVEHPETEGGLLGFIPENADQTLENSIIGLKIFASINALFIECFYVPMNALNDSDSPEIYHPPPLLFSPNRGPPITSC